MFEVIFKTLWNRFMNIRALIYFWREGYRNGGLPCTHCIFISSKLDNSFYPVWMTCTNPEFGGVQNDGCNWGNI